MTAISVSERLLEMAAFYTPLALTVTVVLSVGIAKGGIPLVTVEASPENLCYRLPVQLNEWAMTLVSMANTGEDLFPAEVIFTKAENRIYADII